MNQSEAEALAKAIDGTALPKDPFAPERWYVLGPALAHHERVGMREIHERIDGAVTVTATRRMNVGEARYLRACMECGKHGAALLETTKGENPGRFVRVCFLCVDHWVRFGLRSRDPVHEEKATPAHLAHC